jgi:succinate-acetate transporter protein
MESSVRDRTAAPGARTADAPDPTRDETAQAQTARVVETKPVTADPGPLGLAAFALTTFVLSMFNSGLMSDKGLPIVLGLALAYGGFAQLLAGMWEFRTGNTFGAVAFTSYGAFWISFWAFEQFYAKDITDKVALGNAVGLFLIGWGIFTAYMFIASLRTTVAISVVFLLLATTFIVLGIGNAEADQGIVHAGGFIGIATAIAAWYASFAAVTNSTFGRTVLPVKELKR